jgi:hypothetical protein
MKAMKKGPTDQRRTPNRSRSILAHDLPKFNLPKFKPSRGQR